jgi:hypothetical protein
LTSKRHRPAAGRQSRGSAEEIRRLPQPEYPGHFEVRLVSRNGGIRWKKSWVNISHSSLEEYVGLEEFDDGVWSLYFGPVLLGRFHEADLTLHGARPE